MADDREQIVWQVRALSVLDDLLRAQLKNGTLPPLRWSVQDAGCNLYGESFAEHSADRRRAVQAWAERLGLEGPRQLSMGEGQVRLRAQGTVERVRIALAATLYGDEEEGERG